MLTMMVGANVTSCQLVSIAERMLLETDLDQVTFVDLGKPVLVVFDEFSESSKRFVWGKYVQNS